MLTNKIKINLYGECWKQHRIIIDEKLFKSFNEISKTLKLPLHEALIDPFFYHKLSHPKINGIENLKKYTKSGLSNNSNNQIEIWYKNKKVQKFKISELNNSYLLFPLFTSTKYDLEISTDKGFYVEEKLFGLIGSYELYVDTFDLDKFHFYLFEFNSVLYLEKIIYDNKKLTLKKQDSIITFQNTFEIN